jgi:hypothetical protein
VDHLNISKGSVGPLHAFSAYSLTTVIHCAIDAKDEDTEVGTTLNLFHKNLDNFVQLIHVFLLILIHNSFIIHLFYRPP